MALTSPKDAAGGVGGGALPVCVPMDDNVPPRRYEPMIDFILDRAGLERP